MVNGEFHFLSLTASHLVKREMTNIRHSPFTSIVSRFTSAYSPLPIHHSLFITFTIFAGSTTTYLIDFPFLPV